MQAVVLAAGKSSRFYPYNQDLEHKSLVSLMGKTLLEHTVDALKNSGITDVVIVVGKNSSIPQLLSHRKDVHITFVVQQNPLGMGDALLQAKEHLQENFFLLGAYHMDIQDFAKQMQSFQNNNAIVLIKKDEVLSRYGAVSLEGEKVIDIVEKPTVVAKDSYRLLAMYLLPKTFISELESIPTEEYHFEKSLAAFAKRGNVQAIKTENTVTTLKYAWDLLGVKDYVLSKLDTPHIAKTAAIAADAIISGNVVVEEGATIMEGVCIKGPAYIGTQAKVGNRAIIRGGVIVEEGATIGSQMEIKNSVVMENTTTHAGFIGDSVIGKETKIAAGFITANARLDRQSVKTLVRDEKVDTGLRHLGTIVGNRDNIGIRVSTMPGAIIGNNTIIGPSTTVMKNVEDNKKYFTKFQEVIEENADAK